jgi:hypothetical protein
MFFCYPLLVGNYMFRSKYFSGESYTPQQREVKPFLYQDCSVLLGFLCLGGSFLLHPDINSNFSFGAVHLLHNISAE